MSRRLVNISLFRPSELVLLQMTAHAPRQPIDMVLNLGIPCIDVGLSCWCTSAVLGGGDCLRREIHAESPTSKEMPL